MGRNSGRRREARRRAQPIRPHEPDQADIIALVAVAMRYAAVSARVGAPKIAELNEIGRTATSAHLDPAALVVEEVLSRIRAAWEHGWQPLDLVHVARRRSSSAAASCVARAVLVEADGAGAAGRAPQEWVAQLRALESGPDDVPGREALLAPGGRASVAQWTIALAVLDLVQQLPRSQCLLPPPSQWGQAGWAAPRGSSPARASRGSHHDKTLTRIRALLAKAESTDFAPEAEAFTAKAQDLMTRHAIDEALVSDESGEPIDVRGSRVLVHHPYAMEKTSLLDVIARANRVRAIWNDFASCATLVGAPTDLAQVEMLFTSLLVQATRAMTQAGQDSHGQDRSSSFRKAFLSAYAVRIGERLTRSADAATATYGSALVPVMQRQADAVEGEFDRLFPHVTTGRRRRSFDARGWDAGTHAADAAVLPVAAVSD